MYYEERWIDGKFCWRTSPNGAWTAYTANELAHRYQAELQRAHDLQRALDAEREKVKELEQKLQDMTESKVRCWNQWAFAEQEVKEQSEQLATLQAQLADRDAMILQMGKQAAVLAKESMAVKAQLRQVEGQSKQQAEEAVIVFAKYTTLRQLVEALCSASERLLEDVIGASDAADTLKRRTKQVRATLAAQDAPHPTEERS